MSPQQLALHPVDATLPGHIHRTLTTFLEQRRAEIGQIDETVAAAVESLSRFVLDGGKRIRPTFAWWGWRGAGGHPDQPGAAAVLQAVSALELVQACALVHDDLMDDSARRRGQPTLHVAFGMQHHAAGWAGTPDRFGMSAAILLGDLALAWADDMLHGARLDPDALARARTPWQAMRTEMLTGQYLDVLAQARAANEIETAMRVNRYKTAAYTVERPLHLGASIAGASDQLIAAFRGFGADLGIAFQLRDDLLGMYGDPEATGKPIGDDLREGKRTLLVALGVQHAQQRGNTAALELLTSAVGRADLDHSGVDQVRELLVELGAVEAVERQITQYTDSALRTLASAAVAEPAATQLAELAVAATRRDR